MRFDTPATTNPIDQLKIVGKPVDRIDGPPKTTGIATGTASTLLTNLAKSGEISKVERGYKLPD